MANLNLIILVFAFICRICAVDLNFVIFYQEQQKDLLFSIEEIFRDLETNANSNISRTYDIYDYYQSVDDFQAIYCSRIEADKVTVVLDFIWSTNRRIQYLSNALNVPYFKMDLTVYPFVDVLSRYIKGRHGVDSVFILQTDTEMDQALYGLIEKSSLRILVVDRLTRKTANKLLKMRPVPQYFSVAATTENMNDIFDMAVRSGLVRIPERWNLLFLDPFQSNFKFRDSYPDVTKLVIDNSFYCQWLGQSESRTDCEWPRNEFDHVPHFLRQLLPLFTTYFGALAQPTVELEGCPEVNMTEIPRNVEAAATERQFLNTLENHPLLFEHVDNEIRFFVKFNIFRTLQADTNALAEPIGNYTTDAGLSTSIDLRPPKRYFRVGTAFGVPWSYYKVDPSTGQPLLTSTGEHIWQGYCIDFIEKLAETLDFRYDLIEPKAGGTGENLGQGRWNGLVGDLMTGEIDLAVAAMKMTAEREEVIDFVAPYYEQTGIMIVIRKPVRVTSLFKFMTVLRLEVWLSIVGALIATALLIWVLDKYSPYSAQNNKAAYPYPCRIFSLKESFWFALTSFTPQGGGEAPKSLSGRTLVAAYWLFVVLMLATFTANLAAFLTVERMQTPVQSLEQLARQSRINYTVVEGSETHQYFINMKYAEDILYEKWKEIVLNATTDQSKYRVWDYPISEQYGQILRAINSSNPVANAAEGYANVIGHINADYAFIHDSAEIKYEISRNCNLTEIGEVFAEQPYALAVQQGSNLLDELTKTLLVLQKDRFFDSLTSKYWNYSARGDCSNSDESEGISLESLGGVFIATLFGLAIAMVTLVFEVLYYQRKKAQAAPMKTEIIIAKPTQEGQTNIKPLALWQPKNNKVMIGEDNREGPRMAFNTIKRTIHEHRFGDYME